MKKKINGDLNNTKIVIVDEKASRTEIYFVFLVTKEINEGDVEMAFQYFKGKAILNESKNKASVISIEPLIIADFEDCFK